MTAKPPSPTRPFEGCETFAELLAALMQERGWDDAELCHASRRFHSQQREPKQTIISGWRNGGYPYQAADLHAVRQALEVDGRPELAGQWMRLLESYVFGDLLTWLMEKRHWSDADLSEVSSRFHRHETAVEPRNIYNWRHGVIPTQRDDLFAIHGALEVALQPDLAECWDRLWRDANSRRRVKTGSASKRPPFETSVDNTNPMPPLVSTADEAKPDSSHSGRIQGQAPAPVPGASPETETTTPDHSQRYAPTESERKSQAAASAESSTSGRIRLLRTLRRSLVVILCLIAVVMIATFSLWRRMPLAMAVFPCDALAAATWDDAKPSYLEGGVNFRNLDAGSAITACWLAVILAPLEGRIAFQLGRAHDRLAKDNPAHLTAKKSAEYYYVQARELHYGAGFLSIGLLQEQGRRVGECRAQDTKACARVSYKDAADRGLKRGRYCLAIALAHGWGNENRDLAGAIAELEVAERWGYEPAKKFLEDIRSQNELNLPTRCQSEDD